MAERTVKRMAKYTTEVRSICETAVGLVESKGYNDVNSIIAGARTQIFNFAYPIFDENYRNVLETKILKHYYTREIGAETVGLWKLWLDTKMNEIMPYYNKLYLSELIEFNPLYTHNITKEHTGEGTGETSNSGEVSSSSTTEGTAKVNSTTNVEDKYSDTPQGTLSNVKDMTYLTNADITDTEVDSETETENSAEGSVTSTGSGTSSTTDHYLETVVGYEGKDASSALLKYRETFLNIDVMVINELEDLFMQLW